MLLAALFGVQQELERRILLKSLFFFVATIQLDIFSSVILIYLQYAFGSLHLSVSAVLYYAGGLSLFVFVSNCTWEDLKKPVKPLNG